MTRTFIRPITIALMVYLFMLGATFNGIMLPRIQTLTLPLMVLCVVGWVILRTRQKWVWHQTPLEWTFVLWMVVLSISLLANWDDRRQIMIALWYVGLFVALWFTLLDFMANGKLQRGTLADGILITGLIMVFFGFFQLVSAGEYSEQGLFGFPRPVSLLGNPNFLAGFLIILIPLIIGRALKARTRGFYIFYAVASLILLLLTYSRGGWVGMGAGLLTAGVLMLAHYGLLSPVAVRRWFAGQSRMLQTAVTGGTLLMFITAIAVGFLLLASLNKGGRTLELRTYLYDIGFEMFMQKPLVGHGLFTYGNGLERAMIQHPDYPPFPHNHAHNLILNAAVENGVFGVIALLVMAWVTGDAIYRNWKTGQDRATLIGSTSAVVAFCAHHMLDVTLRMPAMALGGFVVWVIAVAPLQPVAVRTSWRSVTVVLWAVLIVSGGWSAGIYRQFYEVVSTAVETEDYAAAADALQPIVEAEPLMAPYLQQQAFFYGLAGNNAAAIDAYRRLTALRPNTITGWANLAALLSETGEQQEAATLFEHTSDMDSQSWQFALRWAQAAEAAGDQEAARRAYMRLLQDPDAVLHPALQASTLGRELAADIPLTPLYQIVLLVDDNQYEEAARMWDETPVETAAGYVMRALIARELEGREAAQTWMDKAEALTPVVDSALWLEFGEGKLEGKPNSEILADLNPEFLDAEYTRTSFISRSFYFREMILQTFLPQVGYTRPNPVILRLLD